MKKYLKKILKIFREIFKEILKKILKKLTKKIKFRIQDTLNPAQKICVSVSIYETRKFLVSISRRIRTA